MTTTKRKKKKSQRRQRDFRPIPSTWVDKALYKLFVKGIMGRQLVNSGAIEDGTNFFKKMVDAFFLVETRDVHWCRAIEQFMIPGLMWESLSRPSRLIPGTGRRHVLPGHKFILRTDDTMPERNEIEYMDQVFVLSEAQLMAIREKFEAIT